MKRSERVSFNRQAKQLFKELNKTLDEWDKLGTDTNDVRYARNMLSQFYEWANKTPKDDERFNARLHYNQEQADELIEIARSIVNMNNFFVSDVFDKKLIDAYNETNKKNNTFKSITAFTEFIDKKQRFEESTVLQSALSFYEYEALLLRGSKHSLKESQINEYIENVYLNRGLEHEELYEFIYKNI